MVASGLADLTATDARERLIRGEFSALDLADACLARIRDKEPGIGAWAFLDEELVRAQAKAADAHRGTGRALGMLHGLPVGVKDVIDTSDMPTENGTVIDRGRRPRVDASVVRRLREAGAIIMGKTEATELSLMHPGKTRNPSNPEHTPGGSSSGSAAAVASGMIPLAIGTQTAGSVIRPASFCGVVGFKPSHGLIGRFGIRVLAAPLDTVGVFARSVEDAALLADALVGFESSDADTRVAPPPRLYDTAMSSPPVTPALAFVKTAAWNLAEPETRDGFSELMDLLGERCQEVTLPDLFANAPSAHRTLMAAGTARHLASYYERGKDLIAAKNRAVIEEGRGVKAVDYLTALDWREALNNGLDQLFERFDAIVTPAAPGEAPRGLDSTGNPAFNSIWTLCGTPAVTLPLLQGPAGLPVGVQLVGRRGDDARLLRTARWLADFVARIE